MAPSLRVRFESREAFGRVWTETLSRGALFVHAEDPPRLQARVVVELELAFAGAKARLEGEVVHRVPASAGAEAGVAVELLAPLAKIREGLGRFAEGATEPAAAGEAAPAAVSRPAAPAAAAAEAGGPREDDDLFEPDDGAALELDAVVDGPPGPAPEPDAVDISDDDLAAALAEAGVDVDEPDAPEAGPRPGSAAPQAAASRTLAPQPPDPADPLASLDPGALVLSEDDPEPAADPAALPPEGVPFDPHERELGD